MKKATEGLKVDQKRDEGTSTTINTVASSLEEEDGDDIKSLHILTMMDAKCFSKLKRRFFTSVSMPSDNLMISNKDRDCLTSGEALSRTEFIVTVEKILGWPGSGIGASRLFDEVDIEQRGYISWEEFLDHSIQWMGAAESPGSQYLLHRKAILHSITHCRRTDAVAKIITLKTESTITHEVISARGFVCAYDSSFNPIQKSSYHVPLWGLQDVAASGYGSIPSLAIPRSIKSSKMARPWITDAIFMEDINVVVFSASDRSLHFRDVGGRGSPWMFHITGLRNTPTCLAYSSSRSPIIEKSIGSTHDKDSGGDSRTALNLSEKKSAVTERSSILMFGDDMGNVWSLKFLQPWESLFHRSRRKGEGAERIHWLDLERDMIPLESSKRMKKVSDNEENHGINKQTKENPHKKYMGMSVAWNVHAGAVSQVSFCGSIPHVVVSCSSGDRVSFARKNALNFKGDCGASLVLKTESSRASPYIFKIPSGIGCFDLWEVEGNERELECFILATGSRDALIRLWNPYVPQEATANLTGHTSAIKDVIFLNWNCMLLLISVCSNAEIRVWKASGGTCHENTCCLQVVPLSFSSPLSKTIQFGPEVLYVEETHSLLVPYSNEIAVLKFKQAAMDDSDAINRRTGIVTDFLDEEKNNLISERDELVYNSSSGTMKISDTQDITTGSDKWDNIEIPQETSATRERIFSNASKFVNQSVEGKGINELKSLQEKYQKEMKKFVSACTPHLALPIYPPVFVASQPSVKQPNRVRKSNETVVHAFDKS